MGGYRAYPFSAKGFVPALSYYELPYDKNEVAELDTFDYARFQ